MTLTQLRALLALASTAFLAACGGGGDSTTPETPVGATAETVVTGTVTGFGGVAIDGVSYTDRNAVVALDVDPRAATPGTLASVKLGQQVEAMCDAGGNLNKITVRATVIGPVESVGTDSFKVLGQTIKVVTTGDAMTVFDGIESLADLKVDDWVEVHGTIDADKNIVATRVEVQPAAGLTRVRAGGLVSELNESAFTFRLGDLTVDYKTATITPEGATLAENRLVFVYSEALPVNGVLTAKAIRVVQLPVRDARRVSIGGLVTDAAPDGKTFKVNGISVDASNAELKGGHEPTFDDIKNMTLVRVEGTLSGTGSGVVVVASRVWINPASEHRRVMLNGQVTDFVSAADFKVRGVPVDADAARFVGGSKSDLENGAFVTIKGRVDGAKVKADEVRFNTPPRDRAFVLLGTVSDYDRATDEFKLLGIPMKLDAAATFTGGTKDDFSNGDVVVVKGSFNGTVFLVTAVEFKPLAFAPVVYLSGTIEDITVGGTRIKVNGAEVKITSETVIVGGPLAIRQRVEVTATLVGSDLTARRVEVQTPSATAYLRGPVADLDEDEKSFTVNGQKVMYGTATFTGGTADDLANGREVRVYGSIDATAGVIKATQVMLLRSMM